MDLTKRYERVKSLSARVALMGAERVNGSWEAPWVPHCDAPVEIDQRTPDRMPNQGSTRLRPYSVKMLVPCRQCPKCRQIRQLEWRDRMAREVEAHQYSTFLTFTFSPAHLAGVLAQAARRGGPRHRAVESAGYRHIAAYWKRLRKGRKHTDRKDAQDSLGRFRQRFDPLTFRFFCCAEYGEQNSRLHFHALVHSDRWIPEEVLKTEWRSRCDASLVRSGEACSAYVSKYLTKNPIQARPWSSRAYGKALSMRSVSTGAGEKNKVAQ
jgi:hypothetical protein